MRTSAIVQAILVALMALPEFHGANARADMLVGDLNDNEVLRFDNNNHLVGVFASGYEPGPIAVDSQNRVYIYQSQTGDILRYTSNGQYLGVFGHTPGGGSISFGMDFDSSGNLFIREGAWSLNDIAEFNTSGLLVKEFNTGIHGQGDIAIDSSGVLYVPRSEILTFPPSPADGIYRMSASGTLLGAFGQATNAGSGLTDPESTAFDKNGNLYVVGSEGIYRYDSSGNFLGNVGMGIAEFLTIDNSGNLFGGDGSERGIFEIDSHGNAIGDVIQRGFAGVPSNFRPWGVAILPVPEPSTFLLNVSGVGLLLACARRRFGLRRRR